MGNAILNALHVTATTLAYTIEYTAPDEVVTHKQSDASSAIELEQEDSLTTCPW